ncbi:MAG TPA: NAD-dependent succinate-semialdehyde dehydrogenase [Salinimicrobium sp.]|nr:NAD-dependent succinate-semialdehyde dehydrogenase [Salinimicrobium sp.]
MISSMNPFTGKSIKSYKELDASGIEEKLSGAKSEFLKWKKLPVLKRLDLLTQLSHTLYENKNQYAQKITEEMGKPISQSVAEIEKCAWVCEYYASNAESFLKDSVIDTDAISSYVKYEPLGVILGIMPWNYPFWQVFRFAVPTLAAGNVCLLKHASNVMGCAFLLEEIFLKSGFPKGCFQNLCVGSEMITDIIQDSRIKAVSLTGSEAAGSSVAVTAGKQIKKTVLELGGSNAMVIFEDAQIEETIKSCVDGRFLNTGQSCIAGKRFLVHKKIESVFLKKFKQAVMELKIGDPMNEETYIGVLAREDLAEDLGNQVQKSVKQGAKILCGGNRKGTFFEPTLLTDVHTDMPVFQEETFGPVAAILSFETEEEMVKLVNNSKFGLGVSLFTEDMERVERLIPQMNEGAVFVNSQVKSDPRLPFGGTKKSGYGRELSKQGIMEFVNKKTVYINKY